MGSGFVKALLKKGEQVQIWNRTASKAKLLEADGAKAYDNIIDAVEGASRIAPGAAERAERWKKKGFTYLHAPVLMGPQNALDSTGFMMISGDQKIISKLI